MPKLGKANRTQTKTMTHSNQQSIARQTSPENPTSYAMNWPEKGSHKEAGRAEHDVECDERDNAATEEHERTSGRTWYADDGPRVRGRDGKVDLPRGFVKTVDRGKKMKIQERKRVLRVDRSYYQQAEAKSDRTFCEQIARERICWDGRRKVDERY